VQLLVTALIVIAGLATASQRAGAQPPPICNNCAYPPLVTFTPTPGVVTPSLQTLTIAVCDTVPPSVTSVTWNGTSVSSLFVFGSGTACRTGNYTITAAAQLLLLSGTNTLRVIASAQTQTDTTNGVYTFTPPPIYGISVIAATGHINALSGSPGTANFTVTNTGTATDTISVTRSCTGSGLASCGTLASPDTLIMATNAARTVSVSYTMGSTSGNVGTIQLNAVPYNHSTAFADSGWTDVTVQTKVAHGVALSAYNPGSLRDPAHCLDIAVRPGLAVTCGDLRFVHALPSVRTYNKVRTPALIYESQMAHPYLLTTAVVTADTSVGTIDSVVVQFHNGGTTVDRVNLPGSSFTHGVAQRTVLGFDDLSGGTSEGTNVVVATTYGHIGGTGHTTTDSTTGYLSVQNNRWSDDGRGWMVAGLEHLHFYGTPPTGALLWTTGADDRRYYQAVSGQTNYWTTQQLDHVDTITYNTTTKQYTRLAPHRVQAVFDSLGRHIKTIDRLGYVTTFVYRTNSSTSVDIDHITVPSNTSAGVTYQFFYNSTSGYLDSVYAPNGSGTRVDRLFRDGNNQVVKLEYPDGTSDSLVYSGASNQTSLISAIRDRRGMWTTIHYDTALKVKQVAVDTAGLGGAGALKLTTLFTVQQSVGYHQALTPDSAYSIINGPRFDTTITRVWLDQFGSPLRIRNAIGNETLLTKLNGSFPALVTRVKYPNERVVGATYDSRANLASETDSSHVVSGTYATTRYNFDQKWDFVTNIVRPDTDSTSFSYDATYGNRQWEEPNGDSTRRVRYTYGASGTRSAQLLIGVAPPIEYSGGVAHKTYYDSLFVDDSAETTPKGYVTRYLIDGAGRRIRTMSQIDSLPTSSSTHWRVDTAVYDLVDHIILTASYGPRDASTFWPSWSGAAQHDSVIAPAETLYVKTFYQSQGHVIVDSVTRYPSPDPNLTHMMTTHYAYDAAGRLQADTAPDGNYDTFTYDAVGNEITHRTRRANVDTMTYDALNRKTSEIVPSVTYGPYTWFVGTGTQTFPLYPNCSGHSYCTARDVASFAYDAVGNLVQANNTDARVKRAYNAWGAIAVDSLAIRTVGGGDFTDHAYGLSYSYDLDGRRATLTHPANLAPDTGGVQFRTQQYTYDHLNELWDVFDVLGQGFILSYDLDGRLTQIWSAAASETMTYDVDGRLITRLDSAHTFGSIFPGAYDSAVLHRDTYYYDGQNRLVEADESSGLTQNRSGMHYSAFGALAHGLSIPTGTSGPPYAVNEEMYITDGLGNRVETWENYIPVCLCNTIDSTHSYQRPYYTGDGTARLAGDSALGYRGTYTNWDTLTYDAAGNRGSDVGNRGQITWPAREYIAKARLSYYDAAERLRVVDKRACIVDTSVINACETAPYDAPLTDEQEPRFEEYFYDALGRRVLVRSRNDSLPCNQYHVQRWSTGCFGTIARTVYDGDQVLYEIRRPGDDSVQAANLEIDTGSVGQYYSSFNQALFGRLVYTHGELLDRPLDIIRIGYSAIWPRPVAVVPHTDMLGKYDLGTFLSWGTTLGEGLEYQCTNYALTPLSGDTTCVNISWPVPYYGMWQQGINGNGSDSARSWVGSLVELGRDKSSFLYRRNRAFDPVAGSFTQEDPIGLAGGLNAYGFANGDPVNYDDPFGLCPIDVDGVPCTLAWGALGGAAGLTVGVAAAVVTTAGTLGAAAPAAPVEIGTLTLAGALIGGTAGLAIDTKDAAVLAASRLSTKIHGLITGIMIGLAKGNRKERELGRPGTQLPATETEATTQVPKKPVGSSDPTGSGSPSPSGGSSPDPQSPSP